jgi:hypothetical protein
VEGDASVFGVYGSVMAKQEIASHEGTSTLHALERALLGVCDELLALFDGITMISGLDARPKVSPARDPGEKEGKEGRRERNNKTYGISHVCCDARSSKKPGCRTDTCTSSRAAMISASARTPPLAGRSWRAFSGVVFAWGRDAGSSLVSSRLLSSPHRAIVEAVWRASVGVGFKVRLDCVAVDCAFVSDLWSWMGGGCIVGWLQASSRRGRFSRGQEQCSQVARFRRGENSIRCGGMYVAK